MSEAPTTPRGRGSSSRSKAGCSLCTSWRRLCAPSEDTINFIAFVGRKDFAIRNTLLFRLLYDGQYVRIYRLDGDK